MESNCVKLKIRDLNSAYPDDRVVKKLRQIEMELALV